MNPSVTANDVAELLMMAFSLPFLMCGFALALQAFWVWMLVDCAVKRQPRDSDKLMWVLIIIFTNWIGALLYFLVQRPKNLQGRAATPVPPKVPPALPYDPDPDRKYYENYGKDTSISRME